MDHYRKYSSKSRENEASIGLREFEVQGYFYLTSVYTNTMDRIVRVWNRLLEFQQIAIDLVVHVWVVFLLTEV